LGDLDGLDAWVGLDGLDAWVGLDGWDEKARTIDDGCDSQLESRWKTRRKRLYIDRNEVSVMSKGNMDHSADCS
jgi:hypothetical protein